MVQKSSVLLLMTIFLGSAALAQSGDDSASEAESPRPMPNVELKPPEKIEDQTADFLTVDDLAIDDPKRCITNLRWDRAEILSDKYILFKVGRSKYFVNELNRRCAALRPGRKLLFQQRSSRTCRRDAVTVLESGSFGRTQVLSRGQFVTVPGNELGTCLLGYFNEVNKAGLDILRTQAEAERQLQRNRKLDKRRKKKDKKKKKAETES